MNVYLQYAIIAAILMALMALLMVLKKKKIIPSDNVYALVYAVLEILNRSAADDTEAKKVIEIVLAGVKYVEANFKDSPYSERAEKAFQFIKPLYDEANFETKMSDDELKNIIELVMTIMTYKKDESEVLKALDDVSKGDVDNLIKELNAAKNEENKK